MSGLARWELHGPVRPLRTQFAEWNPEDGDWRPLKNRLVATIRPDGEFDAIEHHQSGRIISRGFSRRDRRIPSPRRSARLVCRAPGRRMAKGSVGDVTSARRSDVLRLLTSWVCQGRRGLRFAHR